MSTLPNGGDSRPPSGHDCYNCFDHAVEVGVDPPRSGRFSKGEFVVEERCSICGRTLSRTEDRLL